MYLKVQLLKTKNTVNDSRRLRKDNQTFQLEKTWVDYGVEFLSALKSLVKEVAVQLYSMFSEKTDLTDKNIRSLFYL